MAGVKWYNKYVNLYMEVTMKAWEAIASILGMIIGFAIVTRAVMQVNRALKAFDAERDGE